MADDETDYLIIGAGAVGLAFADALIDEDPDCHITFVDKHARPGGHWNDAYPFVALHQPSAFYGVNSMAFPSEQIDPHGPNKGLYALASGAEVTAYFERVMNHRLLPSGRVAYHRLSEFRGRDEGGTARIIGVLSGAEHSIAVRRKLVDATFYQTSVPATHTRAFAVAGGVRVTAPGALPDLWKDPSRIPSNFVILGGGKTAMDTGVWLIEAGVDPARIHWVRPRDSWLNNRKYVQPGEDFLGATVESQIAHLNAFAQASDGHDVFEALERGGYMLRLDPDVRPDMYHYAVISEGEIALLRRITQVIRTGRVTAIEPGKLLFGDVAHAVPTDALFIDCTARAVPFSAMENSGPQFRGDTIVLQPVNVPLVTLSAAITAFLEAHYPDDATKNQLARAGPLTDTPETFPYAFMMNMMNRGTWSQTPEIAAWLAQSRLDPTAPTIARMMAAGDPRLAVLAGFRAAVTDAMPAVIRLGMAAKAIHETPRQNDQPAAMK
ncbi:NAD(P)-binding protein [Erythrobacter sanguineus]|uniref:Pyridine nucleotide-disulphide oxidoreductase n=1 Tax=Erythrobacter sanguineus TaxID=198312 RepID=A0A1M7SSL5_9SPHN|nr:NAD(P)-binding protein [Erythrobacter sanguineus]SHN61364.1 Pyridine nucleotide-disulphide oxidoreductase [Erythrobacter sanguineus]